MKYRYISPSGRIGCEILQSSEKNETSKSRRRREEEDEKKFVISVSLKYCTSLHSHPVLSIPTWLVWICWGPRRGCEEIVDMDYSLTTSFTLTTYINDRLPSILVAERRSRVERYIHLHRVTAPSPDSFLHVSSRMDQGLVIKTSTLIPSNILIQSSPSGNSEALF